MNLKSLQESIEYRRSVRIFDPNKEIDIEIVKKCIQNAILSPNSSNLQLTEYYHITSPGLLKKMQYACLKQNAAKTAKNLLVLVVRRDLIEKRAHWIVEFYKKLYANELEKKSTKLILAYYTKTVYFMHSTGFFGILGFIKYLFVNAMGLSKAIYRNVRKSDSRIVAHKSAGIAAQSFMLSMASYGYDTCPMEGIDSLRIKKLLDLPYEAEICMVIACGIRAEKGIYGPQFRLPLEKVYKEL